MRELYLYAEMHSLINRSQIDWVKNNLFDRNVDEPGEQVAKFIFLVARCCERALYHGVKIHESLVSILDDRKELNLNEGEYTHTKNKYLKFEIEAYLAAVKTLLEIPVGSMGKQPPMMRLLDGMPDAIERFSAVFSTCDGIFQYGGVTNRIRNTSTHVLKDLHDQGYYALIGMFDGRKHVVCTRMYRFEEYPDVDLVKVFAEVDECLRAFFNKLFHAFVEQILELKGEVKENMFVTSESQHCRLVLRYRRSTYQVEAYEIHAQGEAAIRRLL
ncbi:hypothetical protein ACRSLK_11970 [Halopseudomonas pachastrellae]|uniref:hypothetical protein n=1 Tax=Halopseudomonas pachastrellae TaxID=254161 RepID=UPI003D7DF502